MLFIARNFNVKNRRYKIGIFRLSGDLNPRIPQFNNSDMYHKNVIPFVRYGIMLGARETYPLPGRLFRHGTNFDFLFSFVDYIPSEKEATAFVDMLKREIVYSRQIEEILSNSRSRGRKRYFMLQKEFHLEEMD